MYEKTYSRLNIRFDTYGGESQVPKANVDNIVNRLVATGFSKKGRQGGLVVDFREIPPTEKALGAAVIEKSDGTSLYLTRDIAEALSRYERYNFDRMLYVVGRTQDLHVQQIVRCLELIGEDDVASKCQHISFGNVEGMSTRRGTAEFLEDILDDVRDKVYEIMIQDRDNSKLIERPQLVADQVGVAAVAIQDMKAKRYVMHIPSTGCSSSNEQIATLATNSPLSG
jgi:arginyl-tRNA synthetase